MGSPMRIAIADVSNVPKINGKAPYTSCTGSQVDPTTNPSPNLFIEAADPAKSSTASEIRRAMTNKAAAARTTVAIVSPLSSLICFAVLYFLGDTKKQGVDSFLNSSFVLVSRCRLPF